MKEETVDGEAAELELAGWWSRAAAWMIDGLVICVPVMAVYLVVVLIAAVTQVAFELILLLVFPVIVTTVYWVYTMQRKGIRNGQSVGKQAMDITVVKADGTPVTGGYAFLRQIVVIGLLFGGAGVLLLYLPYVANYLWPLWDEKNQCLHDKIMKSYVVKVKSPDPTVTVGASDQRPGRVTVG